MDRSDFLASYGAWDAESFLRSLPDREGTLLLILLRTDRTGPDARRDLGSRVEALWKRMFETFPRAHGHRLAWSDLAFLIPTAATEAIAEAVSQAVRPAATPGCEVLAGLLSVPREYDARLAALDDLNWRLGKIDYRAEYPNAWCIRDGEIVHRPDQ
jgi:hypothetical protein